MVETERPRTRSIGDVLDDNRGVGPGFDFLRVALAFGIVAWHAPQVANGAGWPNITRFIWFPNYGIPLVFTYRGSAGKAARPGSAGPA